MFFTGEFLLTNQEKRGKEKGENGEGKLYKGTEENVNCKGKVMKMSRGPFFFLLLLFLSLFETTEICLGSTKMEISTRKKHISRREKIKKVTLPP